MGAQATPAIRRSQHGTVSQLIAATEVSVAYNRPVARGRTLFGGLVPWNRIWHPGADSATTISFSRGVEINGQPVPAGTYSLWTIPRPERWTLILSTAARVFHIPYPGEARDALRLEVTPEKGSHMETLSFYFPLVDADSATLVLHWGTTIVPLGLRAR
ncbi:MAG: DUF2911 domain-containing protein [Gemmatimonadetes bacterium]|nr:DUF2911 domain-containing protein [Gemmatimonadota bacterium]